MTEVLRRILPNVQKPARYVGGEYGQIVKELSDVRLRVAFCFPDTYEIGMSNVGMRILYGVMNRMDGVWCERVFAPWGDMEEQMRKAQLPLWALESGDPIRDFDLVAFTIGYEMSYTNILNMLDLAGIPLYAKDRHGLNNMVFAGGVCAVNPEPLADFIDFFSVGEGEEITVEILELYDRAKTENWEKEHFLVEVEKIPGIYVPSHYVHQYGEDGKICAIEPLNGAPEHVVKRIVKDLDSAYYPTDTMVPSTEIVHDRTNLEVFRGCIRGCRFCQAGFCYRPVRPRNADTLYRQAVESLEYSGNHEITLSSLSTSDYKQLEPLADQLMDYCEQRKINLSLPSLRADNFSKELMMRVQRVRKSSLTFAPEAGTQRLRDAINKNVTEEEIIGAFNYWQEQGVVQVINTNPMEVRFMPLNSSLGSIKKYKIGKYTDFNIQVQEILNKRMLTPTEFSEYYNVIEKEHIEPEALVMIIKYCANLKGENVTYPYIITVAKNWATEGVHTCTDVENKITELGVLDDKVNLVLGALGTKRKVQLEDVQMLNKWLGELDFDLNTIIAVAKRLQLKKSKADMNYLNNLLNKYYEMRLNSIIEIENYETEKDNMTSLARQVIKGLGLYYEDLTKVIDTYIIKWVQMGYGEDILVKISDYCFKNSIRTLDAYDRVVQKLFKLGIVTLEAFNEYLNDLIAQDEKVRTLIESLGIKRYVNEFDR